jgi:anti-sigma factor RsiW
MPVCHDMIPLILGAVDGTLDEAGLARLSEHVERCSDCREGLAAQRSVRVALAGVGFAPVSPGFALRVRELIAPKPSWLDLTNWRAWTLRLAPVAVLLCLLAWWPSSRDTASAAPLSSVVRSWAAGTASETAILVDPAADASSLMSAALGESSR